MSKGKKIVEKNPLLEWAEREVALACEHEKKMSSELLDASYGIGCYNSALKAFRSLCEDGHSGFSISMTKFILNRLIEGKPLTFIEDDPNEWDEFKRTEDMDKLGIEAEFQCKRIHSLCKTVYKNGKVVYTDTDRFHGVNVDNPNASYHSGLIDRVMEEIFPITMPYFPESKPFRVYCKDFLTDRKNGDFDTVGILYAIKPNGERVEINRYFKEENGEMVEIYKKKRIR